MLRSNYLSSIWTELHRLGFAGPSLMNGGVIKMASCYIIYYSWISPSHGCEAIRVLGRSLQRRIGKATFNTAFFLFLFLFWKICAKENDLQQLEA